MEDNKEMELDKKNGSNNEAKETVDEKPFHYKHARANIAVDVVVFGVLPDKDELHVFVQRDNKEDMWSLPGRIMHCGTDPNDEIAPDDNWDLDKTREIVLQMSWPIKTIHNGRVLKDSEEYTIVENPDFICQLEVMSKVERDSRNMRVLSVPFMTLIRVEKDQMPSQILCEDAEVARWLPLSELITADRKIGKIELDHDHFEILLNSIDRLAKETRTRPLGRKMLPEEFELSELIRVYNMVLKTMDVKVEKSNLRKLLIERGVIKEVKNESSSKKGGSTYRFVDEKYDAYISDCSFGLNQNQKKPKDNVDKKAR